MPASRIIIDFHDWRRDVDKNPFVGGDISIHHLRGSIFFLKCPVMWFIPYKFEWPTGFKPIIRKK